MIDSFHLPDYDTVLFKNPLLCTLCTNLSHLTTNLFLCVLFYVFPVCYNVRLSQLNKDNLFTY